MTSTQTIITAITLLAIPVSGCQSKKADVPGVMDPILSAWQQGDQGTAIRQFVEADWSKRPLFGPSSHFNMTEKEFEALSTAEQEAKTKEFLPRLTELRELGKAVIQAGNDAAAQRDMTKARQYITAARRYGDALGDANHFAIIQLVGKAVKKMADEAAGKLGA